MKEKSQPEEKSTRIYLFIFANTYTIESIGHQETQNSGYMSSHPIPGLVVLFSCVSSLLAVDSKNSGCVVILAMNRNRIHIWMTECGHKLWELPSNSRFIVFGSYYGTTRTRTEQHMRRIESQWCDFLTHTPNFWWSSTELYVLIHSLDSQVQGMFIYLHFIVQEW